MDEYTPPPLRIVRMDEWPFYTNRPNRLHITGHKGEDCKKYCHPNMSNRIDFPQKFTKKNSEK